MARKLTLISAPAGYGKSTLLSDYLARSPRLSAWLSLDEADNEPKRFLSYLKAALEQAGVPLSQSGPLTADPEETLLTALLNDLVNAPDELELVLDDYHLIVSNSVHALTEQLIDHAPPTVHLIISTRRDPPLPLPRLRARGELVELRADALRFQQPEVTGFLEQVMGLTLPEHDIAELSRRTEGWIAGVQLAALSLRGREQASDFIERFTGTDRFVLDYLSEEVLQKQPDEVQDFLMLTSVLNRLSGPLCDAVTEQRGGQARLEALERENLFISPLDHQRHWYRYHAFFADLLKEKLERHRPDLIPELHRRAGHWFANQKLYADALRHAVLAHNRDFLSELLTSPQGSQLQCQLSHALKLTGGALLDYLLGAERLSGEARHRLFALFETLTSELTADPLQDSSALLPEPLSERELEVLRLMAAGLSNKAIAKRLDITLNTVKTHTKSINAKLGVKSRVQASIRARELELV